MVTIRKDLIEMAIIWKNGQLTCEQMRLDTFFNSIQTCVKRHKDKLPFFKIPLSRVQV